MVTVINDGRPVEKIVRIEKNEDSSAGWIVAVLILLAVIIGGIYVWKHNMRTAAPAPAQNSSANINVTVPVPSSSNGSGNTSSDTGEGTANGNGSGTAAGGY